MLRLQRLGEHCARHDSHLDDLHCYLHGAGRSLARACAVFGCGHQRIGIRHRRADGADLPDPLQCGIDAVARPNQRRQPDRGPVTRHHRPRSPGRRIRTPACRGRGPGGVGKFGRRRSYPCRDRRNQRARRAGQADRGFSCRPRGSAVRRTGGCTTRVPEQTRDRAAACTARRSGKPPLRRPRHRRSPPRLRAARICCSPR